MSEAQIFAVTLTLLPIMAFAAVYVVLLCRHGKVDDGEAQIVLMKGSSSVCVESWLTSGKSVMHLSRRLGR